jgi:hypothetical protein
MAGNVGPSNEGLRPGGIVIVQSLGITKADAESGIAVDAAKLAKTPA